MAGPTEFLTDDVEELRKDLFALQLNLTNEIGEVKIALAKQFGEVKGISGKLSTKLDLVVACLGALSLIAIIGLCTGFYWAGSIDTSVKELRVKIESVDARFDKVDIRFDKMEARMDKMDARMDRIESQMSGLQTQMSGLQTQLSGLQASMAKLLEQTKSPR